MPTFPGAPPVLDVHVFMGQVGDGVCCAPRHAAAAGLGARDGGGAVRAQQLDQARDGGGAGDEDLVVGLDRQQAQHKAGLLLDVLKAVGGDGSSRRSTGATDSSRRSSGVISNSSMIGVV
jgi:hypothetical protein